MTGLKRKLTAFLVITAIMISGALGTVYADQPYRGTVKHKASLRNADINRAEDRYTDIDGSTKDADNDTVSISFTADMEQSMETYARVSTYFKAESGHYPRSFMLDAGNYSNAAPYNNVFAQYYPGITAMGKAGYDIVGIGYSEVAQGGKNLTDMLTNAAKSKETLPYVTSANIAGTNEFDNAFKKYGVNDYLDMNKYRTEIAVFSLVGKEAFDAAAPDKLRFEDPVKTAKKLVAEIKRDEDADMIICMCASGVGAPDKDKTLERKIAKSVPGIDMIISCGSNSELSTPETVNGARIFSLASGNKKIGRIEYVIENNSYKYSGYRTITLDDRYKEDKNVTDALKKIANKANKNFFAANGFASGQVLCDSFFEFAPLADTAGQKKNAPLGELIADSYRYAATEDAKLPKGNLIALASSTSAEGGIGEGKLTVDKVYEMMSIGKADNGTKGQALTSFYLTGEDVKALAEIAAVDSSEPAALQLYFSGLNFVYNPHRFKDSRVYDITNLQDNTGSQIELKNDSLYRIVTDKGTAQTISELVNFTNEDVKVLPKDENGKVTETFTELTRSIDKDKPLKSWVALSLYSTTFSESGINATYKEPDGRMVYDDSKEFSHVYKGQFFTLAQLGFVALVGIVALVVLILLIMNLLGVNVKSGKNKGKKK